MGTRAAHLPGGSATRQGSKKERHRERVRKESVCLRVRGSEEGEEAGNERSAGRGWKERIRWQQARSCGKRKREGRGRVSEQEMVQCEMGRVRGECMNR